MCFKIIGGRVPFLPVLRVYDRDISPKYPSRVYKLV